MRNSFIHSLYDKMLYLVASGTVDNTGTEALIDSTQDFLSTVAVGDIVINTTTDGEGTVSAVTNDTTLGVLPAGLFPTIGHGYEIYSYINPNI